jgi:hypothetical protein
MKSTWFALLNRAKSVLQQTNSATESLYLCVHRKAKNIMEIKIRNLVGDDDAEAVHAMR